MKSKIKKLSTGYPQLFHRPFGHPAEQKFRAYRRGSDTPCFMFRYFSRGRLHLEQRSASTGFLVWQPTQ